MNILMLGWELPPHNSGGLGVACLHMSKALALQGASIDFVVPYKASHPEITFMNVISATDLDPLHSFGMGAYAAPERTTVTDTKSSSLKSLRDVQAAFTEFSATHVEHSDKQYDAIHAHDWLTLEAGMRIKRETDLPLIVHVHATEFDRAGGNYGSPLVHEIEQEGLLIADRIIAVSNITKQLIVDRYNIPADKVEVIHNALDIEKMTHFDYDLRTYRYLEDMKRQGFVVVSTVTRFTIQKGLIQFMRAAARASEKHDKLLFLLAGDGEQRDELLALSAELGIADKVFFTGFVRGKQWRDAFNVADIFVMSSVSEPFGITALEAAHYGNAIVLTKQSGAGEVLESVMRYDFWDVDALADRLVGIASSSALRTAMQNNVAYEYMRISWHDVAEKCINLYRSVKTRSLA